MKEEDEWSPETKLWLLSALKSLQIKINTSYFTNACAVKH